MVFEEYLAPGGTPSGEWVKLVEGFPARIMIGSDKVARFGNLHTEIQKYYVFLDALSRGTAELVAKRTSSESCRAAPEQAPRHERPVDGLESRALSAEHHSAPSQRAWLPSCAATRPHSGHVPLTLPVRSYPQRQ